jgi:hypothetical protein
MRLARFLVSRSDPLLFLVVHRVFLISILLKLA